jgi:hypothetical protein
LSYNKDLEKIVGSSYLFNNPDILAEYSRDLSFVPPVMPKSVIKPGSSKEVLEIVKWANETNTPILPLSSGPPHFRGDTIPGTGGTVIVDLSRMNKILRIDTVNRVAMVEPGVTFTQLQQELSGVGLSAYMPLFPRSAKSVIGSMLEREPITIPAHHWDCMDPMLCSEIIWGSGDKMRTGEAAGPETIEEQWKTGKAQMTSAGLSQFDENRLVSGAQGTIGIVTWSTLKCRYLSKLSQTFLTGSESLGPLIDLTYQLLRIRLGDHCFILNGLNLASLQGRNYSEIKALKAILPRWILIVSFEGYGVLPEKKVEYQQADFKDLAQSQHLKPATIIPGVKGVELSELLSKPSPEPYWKLRLKGSCQEVLFLTTLDKIPGFISQMSDLAQSHGYPVQEMGVYIQPTVQGTSVHCEFDLFYDPAKHEEIEAVKWLVSEGSRELGRIGAFFSRPYGSWAEFAYGPGGQSVMIQRKVKGIFDPKGILNPGKLGY